MYTELHARSAFSFLEGASLPEELVAVCAEHGMAAMALLDRDGVYGAPRFYLAAKKIPIRAHIGAEVTSAAGWRYPLLVTSRQGYQNLCRLITKMKLRAPKGKGNVSISEVAEQAGGLICLTGGEEGPLAHALAQGGVENGITCVRQLCDLFGRQNVYVELQRHLWREEEARNQAALEIARKLNLPLLATNGVCHALRQRRETLDVFTCIRHHQTLASAGRLLALNSERYLKSPAKMKRLFSDLPEAIANTQELSSRLQFSLKDLGYKFPAYPVPNGGSQMRFLRERSREGLIYRYGLNNERAQIQIERELKIIDKLDLAGYFLIVWDIVRFCREHNILVQGRGSAANSAVCYALGITAVDPVGMDLLFERFLSEERGEWPDIDLDLPSGEQRERAIQYVYERYGKLGAAMTANVITYRGRSAAREIGKVLSFDVETIGRLTKLVGAWEYKDPSDTLARQFKDAGFDLRHPQIRKFFDLCLEVQDLPRHLGQHSGGLVVCQGQLDSVVPLEPATMPGRVVVQWDKDDCAAMGIVKVDLLGLGMMAVLQESIEICAQRGQPVDLARLPKDDPATFKLIQEADTVGLFQIESRAQMSTLPRMKPVNFYDLAIEVAIIRPGPIQGDAVNPYLLRRMGKIPITYLDERVRPILERTLGVILFQEQILRVAMELGGFSATEADELRRAIGFTRSQERLDRMKAKLGDALKKNNVSDAAADHILKSLASFALYGFPESHAISFALIAYASAWLKVHRPAAFYAALINCQPMGFYSPASLVQDARRHNVKFLPVCVVNSDGKCRVDADDTLRLGFASVNGLRADSISALLATRKERPFESMADFMRRTKLSAAERRVLSGAGALNALAGHRRAALWQVEAVNVGDDLFQHAIANDEATPSPLKPMTHMERVQADFTHLSLTTGAHPMKLLRDKLPGILSTAELRNVRNGERVKIAGTVTCRQRPGTAKGFCFITLEDETGTANAIVRPGLFEKARLIINLEPALIITGKVQNEQGVIHVMAAEIAELPNLGLPTQASHDFH